MGEWIKINKGSNPLEVLKEVRDNNVWNLNHEEVHQVLDKNDIYFYKVDGDIKLMIYVSGMRVNGVFGYGVNANVEDEYLNDLKKELSLFKDNKEYMEKVNNHILVANVYKKYVNEESLTKEDLEVVYQVKKQLEGFTTALDYKLEEIKRERVVLEDLSLIFDVDADNIALTPDDINENTEVVVGNIAPDESDIDLYENIKHVIGYVYLDNKKLKSKLHIKTSW